MKTKSQPESGWLFYIIFELYMYEAACRRSMLIGEKLLTNDCRLQAASYWGAKLLANDYRLQAASYWG